MLLKPRLNRKKNPRDLTFDFFTYTYLGERHRCPDHIDGILTTPGIDAFIIGPYDLSASLGRPGEFDNPAFATSLGKIREAADRHGIPAGYHSVSTRADEAKKRIEEGYTFLAFGVDFMFLGDLACNELAKLKGRLP